MLESFAAGFAQAFSPIMLILIVIGVILGIFFGASPGLTTGTGIALVLPVTYTMTPFETIALLMGMYIGGISGGLITAILINIPGTPAAMPTTFDGYPMAQQGRPGKALSVGMIFSFLGGTISYIILFTVAPAISKFSLKFSNFEYFSVSLMALLLVASLSGKSLPKGIIAATIGVLLRTVGMAPVDAAKRFTFGISDFNGGFQTLSLLIGAYAVMEILKAAESGPMPDTTVPKYRMRGFDITKREMKEQAPNMLRSALVGTGIGFLPGIGAGIASLLSYTIAKDTSKHPEKFGTGIIDGIVASETANNAVSGGALIPLLTMGIPGDASTTLIMAAMMMQGITMGPMLFVNNSKLIYTIFACLAIGNVAMLVVEYFGMPVFLKLVSVPKYVLLSVVMVLCCIGAFGINNRVFDVWAVVLMAIISYAMYVFEFPIPPMIMGFILGNTVESNLSRALMYSQGSLLPFVTRPISALFLLIAFSYVVYVIVRRRKGKA